jgi:hypothetical protein
MHIMDFTILQLSCHSIFTCFTPPNLMYIKNGFRLPLLDSTLCNWFGVVGCHYCIFCTVTSP